MKCWARFILRCSGVNSRRVRRQQFSFFEQREKMLFHRVEPSADDGAAGDQHQVHPLEQLVLVKAKAFSHEPPRTVANVRLANAPAGNDAKPRRGVRREALPVGQHAALGQAAATLPVGPEITADLDSAGFGKSRELAGGRHACRKGRQTTVSRARPRARRPAKILRPALVAMSARKPCLRLRLIFDGWNVCFI